MYYHSMKERVITSLIARGLDLETSQNLVESYNPLFELVRESRDNYITEHHISYRIYLDYKSNNDPQNYIDDLSLFYGAAQSVASKMKIPDLKNKSVEMCWRCNNSFRYVGESCPNCGKIS